MDEYPTGEPDGDSRLKIGQKHKNVGLAALDDGVGMRCWEMGVLGGLRGEQMRGLVQSLCSCLPCL